jgi:hypothetical protein
VDAERAAREWLRERGADAIEHVGGTLYAHLCRVHDRMAAHGLARDVRLAGLTHAAYGTDGFDVALLDIAERRRLREVVGERAERLVYLYGGCDRGHTWRALAMTGVIRCRFTGTCESPPPAELRAFVDLSIVNELDVAEHDPAIAARYGDYFRDVFARWAPLASPAVLADAERVLGYQVPATRSRHGRPSGS